MLRQKIDVIKNRILNWKYSRTVGVVILIAILVGISFRVNMLRSSDVYAKAEISEELTERKDAAKRDEVEPSDQTTQVLPVAKKGETIMNTADVKDKANFYAVEFTEESEIFTRIKGKSYKDNCTVPLSDLRYLHVLHVGFDGKTHDGEIICNKYIADDLLEIFEELYEAKYPIEKIKLVDEYDADDEASMADNNSSSFNFRYISYTTKISKHGYGLAMDINTLYNPYVKTVNGKLSIEPANAADYVDRSKDFDYKIDEDDLAYKLFIAHGFEWGGSWKSSKDYQHFEVPDSVVKTLYK
ncbi:M15 family metallopeptidase [Pseudobutyrivibrio sp.]|uniref:M15 family metallopeptidase n=1 Tax=Pseudobutyrivibrio sp. TaxID=2014367 RepID=UPI0025D95805|nr:M15 family metallopeptidase [Pseudobutyrivibrio sp.]